MFVCLCAGITDKQIQSYLDKDPTASFEMIKTELGVAMNCGKCAEYVLDMMPHNPQLIPVTVQPNPVYYSLTK